MVATPLQKVFRLFIIKPPKTSIIIPLYPSYYMPQNSKNKISQTELKHYNEFRNIITEALRWVHMTIETGIKLKFETSTKERDQK